MDFKIETEQEAAIIILFSCVMNKHKTLSQAQIDHLSRTIVMCSKFKSIDANDLSKKAISLQVNFDADYIFKHCAPYISEDFRETLFAMIVEAITLESVIDDKESEIIGMAALHLTIPMDRMKMILTTFLIRNKWNVHIIEEMNG